MRIGKQRVETLQIVQTLCEVLLVTRNDEGADLPITQWRIEDRDPRGWRNHPAVTMWRGHVPSLIHYGIVISHEWQRRGYRDTCAAKLLYLSNSGRFADIVKSSPPRWFGDDRVHASHRSNLLRKSEHYRQFGWSEPDTLPYFWPSREEVRNG